jgi:hypothetical protein
VIPLLPSVVINQSVVVSLAGEVTPQSGDGVGRHGGIGVGVNGDRGGLTSLGNKQKSRSPIDTIDNDDNDDDNDASRESSSPTTMTGVGSQIQRPSPPWHGTKIPFVGVSPQAS